ncbi:MFS general substrate transporter [Lepidopterella palustris CBS 459.81]|uniref:MFS general substrate transporter n=1 Tax=Lepidopterella palustris CBS 459.81 TaxID=1314670 RepID=A0A8E2EGH9_9PEZI|nr:MFS general substrate transporter [Lepidopterella palustris CBS 459.81]
MTERRLPVKQLVILSICRLAEPIALTSVFPYLPEMIEGFGVPQNDIARWAGLISSTFSVCQCLSGIPWGAASDHFGRKTVIIVGLCNTMMTTLLWGFSTSLPMAIVARALQGAGNGNVGILRTTVAELCPWKELQPRAFSIMPLVYTIGAIFGPTIGGALSNPLHIDPQKPRGHKFLERFPYVLPNVASAFLLLIGIITGFLFLKETLETRKNRPDYGLILGHRLTAFVKGQSGKLAGIFKIGKNLEREPLLQKSLKSSHSRIVDDEESSPPVAKTAPKAQEKPSYQNVLTSQTMLNLLVYGLLALYTIAYDQLLPVFMHHPRQDLDGPFVWLPLKFAGGYGIDSARIGLVFTFYAAVAMLIQLILFPPVARKIGILRCLRISFLLFPIVFILTPFTTLLPTPLGKEIAMCAILVVRGFAGTFAFPASTILLTNSASSLRTLGTLNGIATSASAIGRAFGPAIAGSAFTMGVKNGYIIAPFWILAAIALLAAIPTFFLIEGEGFSDDADSGSETLDSDDEGKSDKSDDEALDHVSEYGEPGKLLSYASTRSSAVIESDDDVSLDEDEVQNRESRQRRASTMSHRQCRRRSSVPIGMGAGFRRYSSNLGSTGFAGGSWGG